LHIALATAESTAVEISDANYMLKAVNVVAMALDPHQTLPTYLL
jgi:hypothetical protein